MSESGATEREPDPTSERLAHQRPGRPSRTSCSTSRRCRSTRSGWRSTVSTPTCRCVPGWRTCSSSTPASGCTWRACELDITGVHAEALLKVRLEKLADRSWTGRSTTIDRNPQVIEALARTVGDRRRRREPGRPAARRRRGAVLGQAGEQAGQAMREAGQVGQQVGAVGAVADRSLREQAGAQTPGPPEPPSGARSPQPPSRTGWAGGVGSHRATARPRRRCRRGRDDRARCPRATVGRGPGRPAARKARPWAGGAAPGRRGRPGRPRWPVRPGRPCGRPAGASGRRSRAAWARAASTARSGSPAPGRVAGRCAAARGRSNTYRASPRRYHNPACCRIAKPADAGCLIGARRPIAVGQEGQPPSDHREDEEARANQPQQCITAAVGSTRRKPGRCRHRNCDPADIGQRAGSHRGLDQLTDDERRQYHPEHQQRRDQPAWPAAQWRAGAEWINGHGPEDTVQ